MKDDTHSKLTNQPSFESLRNEFSKDAFGGVKPPGPKRKRTDTHSLFVQISDLLEVLPRDKYSQQHHYFYGMNENVLLSATIWSYVYPSCCLTFLISGLDENIFEIYDS